MIERLRQADGATIVVLNSGHEDGARTPARAALTGGLLQARGMP